MKTIRARLTAALIGVVGCVLVALAIALYVAERDAAWQQHESGSDPLTGETRPDGTVRFRLAWAAPVGAAV